MKESNDHIFGRHILRSNLNFYGLLEGDFIVSNGATLRLGGMVKGNIIVQPGGTADIHGMVIGRVTNNGGYVTIFGTVDTVDGTYSSIIDPGAVIKNKTR